MPVSLEKHIELTVEDLITAVAQLPPGEMSDFQLRFEELQIARLRFGDPELAQIADTYRLPFADQERVRELLTLNRENGLQAEEEQELDHYFDEMEQRLDAVADEFISLAEHRKQANADLVSA